MVICSPAMHQQLKSLSFLYCFNTADYVTKAPNDVLTSGFYAQKTPSLRAVGLSPSHLPVSSLGFHSFQMAVVKREAADVVEVTLNDNTTEK